MQATRKARIESLIREELSLAVAREVKDPRVPNVTITRVELSPDGSQAKIYVSILGLGAGPVPEEGDALRRGPSPMADCLRGLGSAAGFLRRKLSKTLTIRHIPALVFHEDRGLDNTLHVHSILKKPAGSGSSDAS